MGSGSIENNIIKESKKYKNNVMKAKKYLGLGLIGY